ncbi:MAG: regulatory protein RecX, partial [Actinomycetota bacterium]
GRKPGKRKRARAPRPSPSELPPAERIEQARAAALRLLSHRERTRAELKTRLRSKGYDVETIEGVLDTLRESGLQSDERFAEMFAGEAHRSRGLASSALQGELVRRGVDRRLASEAATERPEDEEARARELARSRARRLPAGLAPDARRRRIAGYLARRGYPADVCFRMAADAVSGDTDPGDGPRDFPIS